MSDMITATFEDGVLKPTQPLSLPSHTRVFLTIEVLDEAANSAQRKDALEALEDLWRCSTVDSQGERLTRDQLHERC